MSTTGTTDARLVRGRGPALGVDVRGLSRAPGALRRLRATVDAPERLGTDVVAVAEGAPLELDLRLEGVREGVLVSGTVRATATGECARCLEPVAPEVEADVQVLYAGGDDAPDDDADGDVVTLGGDVLDLGPAVRDAVVLVLPLAPRCDEDCAGLCDGCGERLDDLPADHEHRQVDPRLAGLAALLDGQARA